MKSNKEKGITLIALIITVIILVILSAIGIIAVYNSKIVEHAINGSQDYAQEGINENYVLRGTEGLIGSVVDNLRDIIGGRRNKFRIRRKSGTRGRTNSRIQV